MRVRGRIGKDYHAMCGLCEFFVHLGGDYASSVAQLRDWGWNEMKIADLEDFDRLQ